MAKDYFDLGKDEGKAEGRELFEMLKKKSKSIGISSKRDQKNFLDGLIVGVYDEFYKRTH